MSLGKETRAHCEARLVNKKQVFARRLEEELKKLKYLYDSHMKGVSIDFNDKVILLILILAFLSFFSTTPSLPHTATVHADHPAVAEEEAGGDDPGAAGARQPRRHPRGVPQVQGRDTPGPAHCKGHLKWGVPMYRCTDVQHRCKF